MNRNTTSRFSNPNYQQSVPYGRNAYPNRSTMRNGVYMQYCQPSNHQQTALEKLGRSMGYDLTKFSMRDRKLVLADAISTLEKLRLGIQITKRPRELEEHKILAILRELIPESHPILVAARDTATEDGDPIAELVVMMLAASDVINDLKGRGEEFIQKSTAVIGTRALCRQPIIGSSVENALQRMEEWCDAWLKGDLKDKDWETFENCLD